VSFSLQLTSSPSLDQATAQSTPTTRIDQLLRCKWFAKSDARTRPMIRMLVLICAMIQCLRNELKSSERRDEMHGLQPKRYKLPLPGTICSEVAPTCRLYTELKGVSGRTYFCVEKGYPPSTEVLLNAWSGGCCITWIRTVAIEGFRLADSS
jgi:hypothetical protein